MRLAVGLGLIAATGLAGGVAGAADPIPTPIGAGAAYHPRPATRPVPGLRCVGANVRRFGVHLELFANRLVVIVPAGIGVAKRCVYPALTTEPTGVIEVAAGARLTLGHFFSIWGRPLSRGRLLGFRERRGRELLAFVDGRRWRGDPHAIPLRRHAQIVLEIRGYVPPHASYLFPRGL